MAFDFPATPTIGQLYPDPEQDGAPQYVWDGEAWQAASGTAADFVRKTGDVMSGHLGLPVTPAADQAVRKDYVDQAIATNVPPPPDLSGYVLKTGDTMSGPLTAHALTSAYDISAGTGLWANGGILYFRGNGGIYLNHDGSNWVMAGGAGLYLHGSHTIYGGLYSSGAYQCDSTINANGNVNAHGSVLGVFGNSNCHVWYYDAAGAGKSIIYFENASNTLVVANSVAGINGSLSSDGRWCNGRGNVTRTGYSGGNGGNVYNFNWDGYLKGYTDDVYLGITQFISDYRIKKDVVELPSTWDTVKLLRPIKYTRRDFTPPIQVEKNAEMLQAKVALAEKDAAYRAQLVAEGKEIEEPLLAPIEPLPIDYVSPFSPGDDIERWGFLAHELQETLVDSAASCPKDAPDAIQSPDPWPVIAALTKALQEAQVRIEEARQNLPSWPINFPDYPAVGTVFGPYIWDGVRWGVAPNTDGGSNETPLMDSVAHPGGMELYSRGDHVHPTDISRAPLHAPVFTGGITTDTLYTSGWIQVDGSFWANGTVSLGRDPINWNDAATKQYVDARDFGGGYLPIAGWVKMSGRFTSAQVHAGVATPYGVGTVEVRGDGGSDAFFSFYSYGRGFACNFGLSSDHNLWYGGHSFGAVAYKLWSTRDFTSPNELDNSRLVHAGDKYLPMGANLIEPFGGATLTGSTGIAQQGGAHSVRFRYLQVGSPTGGWWTIGYV